MIFLASATLLLLGEVLLFEIWRSRVLNAYTPVYSLRGNCLGFRGDGYNRYITGAKALLHSPCEGEAALEAASKAFRTPLFIAPVSYTAVLMIETACYFLSLPISGLLLSLAKTPQLFYVNAAFGFLYVFPFTRSLRQLLGGEYCSVLRLRGKRVPLRVTGLIEMWRMNEYTLGTVLAGTAIPLCVFYGAISAFVAFVPMFSLFVIGMTMRAEARVKFKGESMASAIAKEGAIVAIGSLIAAKLLSTLRGRSGESQ